MKKLLVLTLVLGLASLASAGIEIVPGLEYDVSGNTLTMTTTASNIGFAFALRADDGSLLSNSTVDAQYAAVNDGGAFGTYYLPDGLFGISASVGAAPSVSGAAYSVDFESSASTIEFVYAFYTNSQIDFDSGVTVLNGQTMSVATVPEPATMGLLGLGALLLRRKK